MGEFPKGINEFRRADEEFAAELVNIKKRLTFPILAGIRTRQ